MDKNYLFNRMELYRDTLNEKQDKFYSFLKYIITISAGLIAVMVSLKQGTSPTLLVHYLFVGTIGLLTLGILFGAIVLYEEIVLLEKSRKAVWENIQLMLQTNNDEDLIEHIQTSIFYRISRFLSFSCFILGLLSLVTYAIMIDK